MGELKFMEKIPHEINIKSERIEYNFFCVERETIWNIKMQERIEVIVGRPRVYKRERIGRGIKKSIFKYAIFILPLKGL